MHNCIFCMRQQSWSFSHLQNRVLRVDQLFVIQLSHTRADPGGVEMLAWLATPSSPVNFIALVVVQCISSHCFLFSLPLSFSSPSLSLSLLPPSLFLFSLPLSFSSPSLSPSLPSLPPSLPVLLLLPLSLLCFLFFPPFFPPSLLASRQVVNSWS